MAEVTNNTKTYDYSMIGSFGSSATKSLSGETINKIRAAEEKAVLDPITKDLEDWELESETFTEIHSKINTLLSKIKPFDLFSSSNNAFEQVSASTSGSGAIFDASDVGSLKEGTYQVKIGQLAQKDVWQSNGYTKSESETALSDSGSFQIKDKDGNLKVDISDINGMTLQEIADEINKSAFASASLEQTGDDEYKLVIKSDDPGLDNALTFDGTSSLISDYNSTTDSDGDGNPDHHPQAAQNLTATIDGVDYNVSSNSITIDGNLKVTATEANSTTTLSLSKDDSAIIPAIKEIASAYNEVVTLITDEIYDSKSPVKDKSGLKDILNGIKNLFFKEYGENDSSAFNFGFEFDKNGVLSIDEDQLGKALTNNYDDVKDFFLGTAENKGFGTQLKEHIDDLNAYNGSLTRYHENMVERKSTLEKEKEEEVDRLDTKYSTMAAQFVQYASIIAQMESSFGGLKMMIQQSVANN